MPAAAAAPAPGGSSTNVHRGRRRVRRRCCRASCQQPSCCTHHAVSVGVQHLELVANLGLCGCGWARAGGKLMQQPQRGQPRRQRAAGWEHVQCAACAGGSRAANEQQGRLRQQHAGSSSRGAAHRQSGGPCHTVDTRQAQSAFRPPVDKCIVTEHALVQAASTMQNAAGAARCCGSVRRCRCTRQQAAVPTRPASAHGSTPSLAPLPHSSSSSPRSTPRPPSHPRRPAPVPPAPGCPPPGPPAAWQPPGAPAAPGAWPAGKWDGPAPSSLDHMHPAFQRPAVACRQQSWHASSGRRVPAGVGRCSSCNDGAACASAPPELPW